MNLAKANHKHKFNVPFYFLYLTLFYFHTHFFISFSELISFLAEKRNYHGLTKKFVQHICCLFRKHNQWQIYEHSTSGFLVYKESSRTLIYCRDFPNSNAHPSPSPLDSNNNIVIQTYGIFHLFNISLSFYSVFQNNKKKAKYRKNSSKFVDLFLTI